jgi:phage I-like protein
VKRLQIFKPGKHTASDRRAYEFAEQQLAACTVAYDPAIHEAPLVVGHPAADAPAYGWAKSLAFDETLQAEPHQVDAAFAEMMNSGRFKKISSSFYLPDAPNNPKPGVLYLRHVGFLGAQPPAVKGLKSASFADGEQRVIE